MFDQIEPFLSRISLPHLNTLFLLGLALFGGTIGGRIFQKIRIPQVVGYIIIGAIIGESGLNIVNHDTILRLQPFNYFALGLIGFMVGGELRKDVFRKYGKQLLIILLCEGMAPFILVTALIGVAGGFILGDWKISFAMALLFGSIASATDPATTTEVLKEYRTRGPLTRTILGIVALDDGLALFLFAIASSIAGSLAGNTAGGFLKAFINPLYEIVGAISIGVIAGVVLSKILRNYSEKERILAFTIGAVLIVVGFSLAIHVEMLLAAMTLGVIVVNLTPRKSQEAFKLVETFTPPIYVLFFVLVGAKLNLRIMTSSTLLFVFIYLFGTIAGKISGSFIGTRISGAPESVKRYLPFGLFPQAGIAIGLSILAAQYFSGDIGNTLIIVITSTTFILQIIGPFFVKLAVTKAGEVGLNITEEELYKELASTLKVEEIMDNNPPLIYENMSLSGILNLFSQSTNLYYPVVDSEKRLLGIITVDNIKNTLMEKGLTDLIVAYDLIEPVVASITCGSSLRDVKKLLAAYNLEYLPVTSKDNKIAGFLERRMLYRTISTKVMELHKKADSLEK